MTKETDIAWAAGLFEGEGSVFIASIEKKYRTYRYPRITLKMTDRDVVERFQSILGCGEIYWKGPPKKNPHYKESWTYQLGEGKKVREIIALFWPYLGERRKAKCIELELAPMVE